MQLGQPRLEFANWCLALVESVRTLVTTVTCDMSRMLFVIILSLLCLFFCSYGYGLLSIGKR